RRAATRLTLAFLLSHSASSLTVLTSFLSAEADATLIGAVFVSKSFRVESLGGAKAAAGSFKSEWTYSSARKSTTAALVCRLPESSESAVATCFQDLGCRVSEVADVG